MTETSQVADINQVPFTFTNLTSLNLKKSIQWQVIMKLITINLTKPYWRVLPATAPLAQVSYAP